MGERVFVPFPMALQVAEQAPFTFSAGRLQGPRLRKPPSEVAAGQTRGPAGLQQGRSV